MRSLVASLVRAITVAGFVVTFAAVVVTIGAPGWADWRLAGLGWRFWMGLADMGAKLAMVSLACCPFLAAYATDQTTPPNRPTQVGFYVLLDVATLVLLMFVPAIAAL